MPPHERLFHHAHAHKLDDPERERWLPPAEVVARLSLRPGQAVADLGAGTGYFALPIARAVAPGGRVYAVDLQPEMLEHLGKRVGELAVTLVHGSAEATTLDAACVDLVFLANVWHEIDDRAAALAEVRRILRPGGKIAIVDWRPDSSARVARRSITASPRATQCAISRRHVSPQPRPSTSARITTSCKPR